MIASIIVIIALVLPGLKYNKTRTLDYMNRNTTSSIMGVFVICIFMSHVLGIMGSNKIYDVSATYFFQSIISQMMVVPFFFYSGYGIVRQYEEQGRYKYLSNFLIRRVLKTYLIYLFCEFFGHVIYSATLGFNYFGFDWSIFLIWNTHWFVFVILALYISIFLVLLLFKNNRILVCVSICLLTICLILLFYFSGKGQHWYNTIIAFPLGVIFGFYKNKFDLFLNKMKTIHLFCALFCLIIIYCVLTLIMKFVPILNENIILYLITYYSRVVVFVFGILLFSYMFTFGNKTLQIISKFSLFSYVTQWFAFHIFQDAFDLLSINVYLYFFATLATTITMCFVFEFVFNFMYKNSLGMIKFHPKKSR